MDNQQKLIDFNTFKEHRHLMRYMDNDIAIVDRLSQLLDMGEEAVKVDCFLIVFCLGGKLPIHFNDRSYTLRPDYCAITLPGTFIRQYAGDSPYTVRIIAFSHDFYTSTIRLDPNIWNIVQYIYQNPILPISRKESYRMYLFKELALQLIDEAPHSFSRMAKHHFFACVFCEMLAHLHGIVPETERKEFDRSRSAQIFRQFMEAVSQDDGTHRSVKHYADLLCYSSKHLSTVVKQFCGKPPIKIINEHTIQKIKYQLKNSDMSIKEMADYFEFTNPSFFGKFVKQHTGMTPLDYRNSSDMK